MREFVCVLCADVCVLCTLHTCMVPHTLRACVYIVCDERVCLCLVCVLCVLIVGTCSVRDQAYVLCGHVCLCLV